MDLPWGEEKTVKFASNVGLITSNGPKGPDIMSAEWTHHVSYSPGLIAVSIHKGNEATAENIRASKQFGVNLAAEDQSVIASVSGGSSGVDVDKIAALKELGFEFEQAQKIDVLMVKGVSMRAECKLVQEISLGSHTMFVGEVVHATASEKAPLVYHNKQYWKLTTPLERPSQEELDRVGSVVAKHKK